MTSYMEHLHMYNKMAANNLHAYDFLYGTLARFFKETISL